MSHFVMISRHSPESCPMNNERTRKAAKDAVAALPELARKYDVNVIGSWTVLSEHLVVHILDAVNLDAVLRFSMEPLLLKWWGLTTSEIKPALPLNEAIGLLA